MKPQFTPLIIGELRHRVIQHNSLVRGLPAFREDAAPLMKLGQLKGLYKKWHGGRSPHEHALAKIDEHLARLREHAGEAGHLNKVEERDEEGRFAGSGGQRAHFADVASPEAHRALADENAGYDASQTQVIPETRFSTFGPPIAGAAGVAYAAYSGATATGKGAPVDRAITAAAGGAGRWAGMAAGKALHLPIKGAARGARAGVGLVNRHAHTAFPRPGPKATDALGRAMMARGGQAGRAAGRAAGIAQQFAFEVPGLIGRRATEAVIPGRAGRIAGRGVGGALSALVVGGLVTGPMAAHYASTLGPYLDTAFPRHVRKSDDPLLRLLDAPEVLAKRDALLGDELAKANLAASLRAVGAATRGVARQARRVVRTLVPNVASHTTGPAARPASILGASTTEPLGQAEAENVFFNRTATPKEQGGDFQVGPQRLGRARIVAGHAASLGIAGAGTGALLGAGGAATRDAFSSKHPRDEHGRFATKAKAAKFAAKVGGAVGLGLGLAAGLASARAGRTGLLQAALIRLGTAAPAMRKEAEAEARNAHARDWFSQPANRRGVPSFNQPPGSPHAVTHEQMVQSIEAHAASRWDRTVGAALRGGPQAYYAHQIDEAFDRAASSLLRKPKDAKPLVTLAGDRIRAGDRNLLRNLDDSQLSHGQTVLWDDLLKRRSEALESVDSVYAQRATETANLSAKADALAAERKALEVDQAYIPMRAQELDLESASLAAIRRFAKDKLGHTLEATTRKDALEELPGAINAWDQRAEHRLDEISREADTTLADVKRRRELGAKDLTDAERMAIRNPFATGKNQHFAPMPDPTLARQQAQVEASRAFVQAATRHANGAGEHLDALVAAQQAALRAGIPERGWLGTRFHSLAPRLATWLHQGALDAAELSSSHREQLKPGALKMAYDAIHGSPEQLYATAAKASGEATSRAKKFYRFAIRNAGAIASVTGIAEAIGAYALATPNSKAKWQPNPFQWHAPRELRIERDRPNPIDRPHEITLGVSYRDRDNQQKFLTGFHVHGKGEKDHHAIPFGAGVEQIRNQVRNRGNQGGGQGGGDGNRHRAEINLDAAAKQTVDQAVSRLSAAGFVNKQMGPPNARYAGRTGGNAGGADAKVAEALYRDHIAFLEKFPGQSANKADRYWSSIKSVFTAPGTELLSNEQRAHLLAGGGGYKRGIFANRNNVLAPSGQADKNRVASELAHQVTVHTPSNTDEYTQMTRALSLLGEHYGLSDGQKQAVLGALDKAFTNATARQPPNGPDSDAAGSKARVQELQSRALAIPGMNRDTDYKTDEDLAQGVRDVYRGRVARQRQMHPDWSEQRLHDDAAEHALSIVQKGEGAGPLAKFLAWPSSEGQSLSEAQRAQRVGAAKARWAKDGRAPQADGPPMPNGSPIAGAAVAPPPVAGAARANLATRLDARHQLSQAGSYGLGGLGYEGAELGASVMGLNGWKKNAFTLGASVLAGGTGLLGGAKLGQALGDTSEGSPNEARSGGEQAARAGASVAANFAGAGAAKVINRVGWRGAPREIASNIAAAPGKVIDNVAGATGKVASVLRTAGGSVADAFRAGAARGAGIAGAAERAAATGTFERLGSEIGGKAGDVAGLVGGEAAEPLGGGIAGKVGGHLLGAALGGGAGWLADEATGYLYRHLGGYGPHVPAMAARSLGLAPIAGSANAQQAVAQSRRTRRA